MYYTKMPQVLLQSNAYITHKLQNIETPSEL